VKKVVIVAGDKSGDLYGGLLSSRLKERFPEIELYSFGGSHLAQHSRQIADLLKHSVCGLTEVVSSLADIFKIFKKTLLFIRELKPDLIILIDFPDFNLRLAKTLDKQYPLFYYVSPQVWAWRKNRIKTIKKYVDKMIVIFEFERNFYRKEAIEALYFGHPLLETIEKTEVATKKIISFLPGSRQNEVKRHLPIMLGAATILKDNLPDYTFRIIRPENLAKDIYAAAGGNIQICSHSYEALAESEFVICASGTATVEAAILGVPYIIIYKINPLSWQILRKMVKTPFVGMANILAGEKIIEEILQEDATPQKLASLTLEYLKNQGKLTALKNNLAKVRQLLTPENSSTRFADFIGDYLGLKPQR
jgi:lipid-A-disaccharide synthase